MTSPGSTEETWEGLLNNRHAYQTLPEYISEIGKYRSKLVAFLPDYKPAPDIAQIRAERFVHMATTGAVQAVRKAQLDLGSTPPERVGVILASATGVVALTDNQLLQFYEINYRKIKTFIIPLGMLDALSGQVSIYFNAQGPNLSVAMACSSD